MSKDPWSLDTIRGRVAVGAAFAFLLTFLALDDPGLFVGCLWVPLGLWIWTKIPDRYSDWGIGLIVLIPIVGVILIRLLFRMTGVE